MTTARRAPRRKASANACAIRSPRSPSAWASRTSPGSHSSIRGRDSGGAEEEEPLELVAARRGAPDRLVRDRLVDAGGALGAEARGQARLHRPRPGLLDEDEQGVRPAAATPAMLPALVRTVPTS